MYRVHIAHIPFVCVVARMSRIRKPSKKQQALAAYQKFFNKLDAAEKVKQQRLRQQDAARKRRDKQVKIARKRKQVKIARQRKQVEIARQRRRREERFAKGFSTRTVSFSGGQTVVTFRVPVPKYTCSKRMIDALLQKGRSPKFIAPAVAKMDKLTYDEALLKVHRRQAAVHRCRLDIQTTIV